MRVRETIKREVEVPGLGERLKLAQLASGKTVEEVIRSVRALRRKRPGISRAYWNGLVRETTNGITLEMLRELELVLGWDSGVKFDSGVKLDE